ncbi:trichohyalin-like isoform X2 [Phyllopteryx taeniolatus]|uniref:trichohyalin-like isoform X2 n=1 Tax=Phyllopteryx taeniolatus TaxID=161469 RepID=UPI002AD30A3E|nr:trichohyalin-like isoform X2 [Phyllopteryx taeniolatus]
MPGKQGQQFKAGDLVFAKMKGFPYWPARISKSDEAQKKRVAVFFFGTHQIGHLTPKHIVPFAGNKMRYGSGVRFKGFTEGMWEIQNTPGVGKKSQCAAKSTLVKSTDASKTTAAAKSTPAKPSLPANSRGKCADTNATPLKASSEAKGPSMAARCAGSTLRLKQCVVKCVPAQTPHGSLSVANELPNASQATSGFDSQAKSVQATKTLRRSSSRSSAQIQTEDNAIKMQTPQEASTPEGGGASQTSSSAPLVKRRRGRPSKASTEMKSDIAQAEDCQTVTSSAYMTASTLRLKPCVVKCVPAKTPGSPTRDAKSDKLATASEPASEPDVLSVPSVPTPTVDLRTPQEASTPEDGVSAHTHTSMPVMAKRRRGRPRKDCREKSEITVGMLKKTDDVPAPAATNTSPESHSAPGAPKRADQKARPSPAQRPRRHVEQRAAAMAEESTASRRGKRKEGETEETEQKGGEEGKVEVLTESTPSRAGKRKKKEGEKEKTKQEGGAEGKMEMTTEESTPSRGGETKTKGEKEETKLEGSEEGKSKVTTDSTPSKGKTKRKEGEKEETKQEGGEEGKMEESIPSRGGKMKRKEVEKEEIKLKGSEEGKMDVPSRGGKRKRKEWETEETKREGKMESILTRGEKTKQAGGEDEKTEVTTQESTPIQGRKSKRREGEKEKTKQRGDEEGKTEVMTEESTPSRGEKMKTKEGGKQETKLEECEEGKTEVTTESTSRGGGKTKGKESEKEETEQAGGKEGKTEVTTQESTSIQARKSKRKEGEKEKTKQKGEEKGKTEVMTEESTPSRGEMKTKEGEKEETKLGECEEGKTEVTTKESTSSGGGKTKGKESEKEETAQAGGEEGKMEELPLSRGEKMKRKEVEMEETKLEGIEEAKTEVTTKEPTPSRGGKRRRKEGEKEEIKQEGDEEGKMESTPSQGEKMKTKERGETKQEVRKEGMMEMTAEESIPSRGGKRKRKEGGKEETKRVGGKEGKTEVLKPAGKRWTAKEERMKATRADAQRDGDSSKKRGRMESPKNETMKRKKEGEKGKEATVERREKKRARKEKGTREGGRTAKETKDGVRTKERRRRLAAKKESVLKSLRGLLKATRGGKRRETATKSIMKSAARAKTKRTRAHKMLKESNIAKKNMHVTDMKDREENLSTATTVNQSGGKVKERLEELQKKDSRKLIGKIVKATTKVQVKTMMGGATLPPTLPPPQDEEEEEEKKRATTTTSIERTVDRGSEEERKPERVLTDDEKAATKRRNETRKEKDAAKAGKTATGEKRDKNEPQKESGAPAKQQSGGRSRKATAPAAEDEQGCVWRAAGEENNQQQHKNNLNLTLTDSTLHRIHGDIRISLKSDNPDVAKCLAALDQLSGIYVTLQHVQRHSELISTLRKMRFYRGNQDIMDKAAMLYNRFKNAFLLGEGEEVVSAAFLRSLLEEKEREEAERCKKAEKAAGGEEDEVGRRDTPSVD